MTPLQYEGVRGRDAYRCIYCGVPTQEGAWHHRRGKAVRDEHTHCSCNGVWMHHSCHQKIHAQPLLARPAGLIVSRIAAAMPAEVPLDHPTRGWVLLTCTYTYVAADAPA